LADITQLWSFFSSRLPGNIHITPGFLSHCSNCQTGQMIVPDGIQNDALTFTVQLPLKTY